jgi:hypothetical protein
MKLQRMKLRQMVPQENGFLPSMVPPRVAPGTKRAVDQDAAGAIRPDKSLEILAQKIICNPAIPLGMRSAPD